MGKDINPSFVEYFAGYLKKLLNKPAGTITAKDFQDQVTTAANVYLKQHYNADPTDVRTAIAQSAPEAECAKAIKARDKYEIGTDNRMTFYKTQTDIGNVDPKIGQATLVKAKGKHSEIENWATKTNMLLYDVEAGKKRQLPVELEPYSAVYCGECWICNTDVMSFTGESTSLHSRAAGARPALEYGTTPCGDCEHVSAIMASYIAGMLTSAEFAKFYWASYYVACVECNRRKSNYIGVKLSATKGWGVDKDGVNAIVDAIFPNATIEPHASEYNPIRNALTAKYNGMSAYEKNDFRKKVYDNIELGTKTWCEAANIKMGNMTEKTKHIKMSFNVSKIIVAITGHLNVITGPLEKRAKKVAKAKRPVVKPTTTGKRRNGGGPGDMEGKEGDTGDEEKMGETDVKYTPILQWYNFIKEVEFDDEDDEDDEDDDDDDKDTYADRMLKYRDLVVDVCNTYGRSLFKQYKSDKVTFKELMDNLSNSMYDILESTNEGLTKLDVATLDALAAKFGVVQPLVPVRIVAADSQGSPERQHSTAIPTATPGTGEKVAPEWPPSTAIPTDTSGTVRIVAPEWEESQDVRESGDAISVSQALDMDVSEFNENVDAESSDQPDKKAKIGSAGKVTSVFNPKSAEFNPKSAEFNPKSAEFNPKSAEFNPISAEFNPISGATFAKKFEQADHRTGSTPVIDFEKGGSRSNKGHSKNNSQTHKQKNRTKRVSYIKHKQTRKNQHSRKTK